MVSRSIIRGPHGGEYDDGRLQGCSAEQFGKVYRRFRGASTPVISMVSHSLRFPVGF